MRAREAVGPRARACASPISAREPLSIPAMTAQTCQELGCGIPNEHVRAHAHTHARRRSLPYFIKVNCIQAGGNVKAPPPSLFITVIKHQGGSDKHNCQATDLHPAASLCDFSEKMSFPISVWGEIRRQCDKILHRILAPCVD